MPAAVRPAALIPAPRSAGDDIVTSGRGTVAARRIDQPRRRLPARGAARPARAAAAGGPGRLGPRRRGGAHGDARPARGTRRQGAAAAPRRRARLRVARSPSAAAHRGKPTPAARSGTPSGEWTTRCGRIDHMLRDVATAARQWAVAALPGTARVRLGLPRAGRRGRGPDRRRGAHAAAAAGGPPRTPRTGRPSRSRSTRRLTAREQLLVLGLALEDSCAADLRRLLGSLSPPPARPGGSTAW